MKNFSSTQSNLETKSAYNKWRTKMDTLVSELAAIGLSKEVYSIPLVDRSPQRTSNVRADWILAGDAILEQTGSRMTITVGQSRHTDPRDRISLEQMCSGVCAPELILSVGRVPFAGSWRPVHLLPNTENEGRVGSYTGNWKLGELQFAVQLQPVFQLSEFPFWVCCLLRLTGPDAARDKLNRSVR